MSSAKAQQLHESAKGHVSGSAVYTDDQHLPTEMLTAYPLQAEHAKAKIKSVDYSAALDIDGVETILTLDDLSGINDSSPQHTLDEAIFPDEISFHAQPILWVVAQNEAIAAEAVALIKVEYVDIETPLLSMSDAIAAESYHGDKQEMKRGDAETALANATHVIEDEFEMGGQDHFYLETHTAWAAVDAEGYYQVHSSNQHPSETQTLVAQSLNIPKNRVTVTSLRMGGGFGGKESQGAVFAIIAALGSRKTGKPVRVRLNRHQDMNMTGKRHGFLGRYKVGFDNEGKLLALDLKLYSDGGWSTDLSHPIMQRAMFHCTNTYAISDVRVQGRVCKTNKTSNTAFRGFGGPQGMIIGEEILDRIARKLKLAPEVVRERNFASDGYITHYHQQLNAVRTERIWSELLESSNFAKRKADIQKANANSPHVKRGLAITPVQFGISFTFTILNQAGALMLIYTDGSIQLNHGGTEMGQGLHTKMLHVASRALGVNVERFRVMPTATDKVPNTSATAASSGSDLNGQAVLDACNKLKDTLSEVAARMLKLNAPEDLIFENDKVFSASHPIDSISFDDVVKQAFMDQVSLFETGYYRTPNIYFDKATGQGRPFYYFSYGAAVSEVEIDGFTGSFKLKAVDILHDVGDSLNEIIDKGQVEGGFVQGMGWLTMEELVWDEQGRLRTNAPSTYKIPTMSDVPEHFNVKLLEKAPQEGVIYGSKAVGEPPFMLANSVREAIRDAVAAFSDDEIERVDLAAPATPEAILEAIEKVK